jgi:hypothetical protein
MKLKRKINLIKGLKKQKKMMIKLKKKYYKLRLKYEIENKSKFYKNTKNKN